MANRREYEIAFVGLKPGSHEYRYEVNEQFFKDRGYTEILPISAQVKLTLDKHTGFMILKFEIGGKTTANCDRCGNLLQLDLWDDFNMVVKLVENPDEMNNQEDDPDIWYISRNDSHIDVSGWIYEFVLLSMPMQRMCKDDENGNSGCNPDVIKKLEEMEKQNRDSNTNLIWKDLEKFKKN